MSISDPLANLATEIVCHYGQVWDQCDKEMCKRHKACLRGNAAQRLDAELGIIDEMIRDAVLAEREAIAVMVENFNWDEDEPLLVAAIRARKEAA